MAMVPVNQGKSWSRQDLEILQSMSNCEQSIELIAQQLGRSEFAIECQLEKLNRNPSQTKENSMPKNNEAPFMEVVPAQVKLQGRDIREYSNAELYSVIAKLELRLKGLHTLTHRPSRLQKDIDETVDNIQKLITYMDAEDKAVAVGV